MLGNLILLVILLTVLLLLAGRVGLLRGQPPGNLGIHDGKLRAPSKTPNSVSSQAGLWPGAMARLSSVEPFALKGSAAATIGQLKALIEAMPRATVIESRNDYLYAQFESNMLRFVDDVEFWFDPKADAVQLISSSRVGRKDFGVNRTRVERIRQRLAAA